MPRSAVGELLKRARGRAGLSREDLARVAGTSRAAVASYEQGRRSPNVGTLERLLAACGFKARMLLEPLWEDIDRRVQELSGPLPELELERWEAMALSLDDQLPHEGGRPARPRRGPVTWAVDGPTALVLQGLAVPVDALDVVVVLDEALRFWMKAVSLVGVDRREHPVQDWYDADLDRMVESLDGMRHCILGFVRVRVVTELPVTVQLSVPGLERPVRVVTVDEVERTSPVHAEVLARWRALRPEVSPRGLGGPVVPVVVER